MALTRDNRPQGWQYGLLLCMPIFVLGLCLIAASCTEPAYAQHKSRPLLHPPFNTAQTNIYMRCADPRVYDGDTIVCKSGYHVRLLGVQAPEIKCRKGVECIPGNAEAARDSLLLGLEQGPLSYQYIRRDNRNRPVVIIRAGDTNLNCWQLHRTDSILKWDHRRRIEKECGIVPGTNQPSDPPDETAASEQPRPKEADDQKQGDDANLDPKQQR
jgi:endonuclease YncB( thermonuclease family)